MAASILDNIRQLITDNVVSGIADRVGETPQAVSKALNAGSTSILGGIANKTGDSTFMRELFDMIAKPGAVAGAVTDDVALAREGKAPSELADMSGRFASKLFGDHASAVNSAVSESSGVSKESASSIMRFAIPITLGFLGRHVRTGGLDLAQFTQLFSIEKNNIMRAAPPGLAAALGMESPRAAGPRDREVPFQFDRNEPRSDRIPINEPVRQTTGSRWMWPALAVLAVLALVWGVRRSHRPAGIDTTAVSGGEVATPMSPPAVSQPPSPSGVQPGSLRLPNGVLLVAPASGVESRLIAFIGDSTRPASEATTFDFDRLVFATNSPRLLPQSDDQVASIAKILAAYPNVSVKIAGYTDNVGNPATNQRLSAQRAENVKAALIKAGVSADRITSIGYGEKNPEADNSTESGRAQNRRVAIIVVKK